MPNFKYDYNGIGNESIQEGVERQLEHKLEHLVVLNTMVEQDLIDHIIHNPEDLKYVIKPSDDVIAAAKYKEL
jgi:hypothetical protein